MYLGAKHMVTGYDHLLFLVGVISLSLSNQRSGQVREPLHAGTQPDPADRRLGDVRVNAYLIDASSACRSSTRLRKRRRVQPFSRLQHNTNWPCWCSVSSTGSALRRNCRSSTAGKGSSRTSLTSTWASSRPGAGVDGNPDRVDGLAHAPGILRHAFACNGIVMSCGFLLVGYQLSGYFLSQP